MPDNIWNDEPAVVDLLDRAQFARALAYVGTTCETPLVIGVYGTWGIGKTSLLRLIKGRVDQENSARTVWFDAWQHQFDENPAVALLHTMVDELGLGDEGKRLLYVIASALGGAALKATKLITAKDVHEIEERYEVERFLIREKQVRLRKHFAELLNQATKNGEIRLVFFIDDLDRCVPEQVLRVLEALKL
ncbi:MAG TPA: P-loop NTPase fold protein, partial [Pseudonocardiaceae bacterium]|nr:P-loop NTPase fold protein [Pseudonocardiaceae bacterium]